jgi:phosphatidylglycerophosphatase A
MTDPDSVPEMPPITARPLGPVVPNGRFMMAHPAHVLALGFGSGLSAVAPGTMGTLWAWALFALLQNRLTESQWGWLIAVSISAGWWVCTVTARHLRTLDPGSIVWDEIAAFWLVLWLVGPTSFLDQLAAFALFRFFDAAKPGPVAWADRLYHHVDPQTDPGAWRKAGWGIMLDDLVAAFCTLLVIALWRSW